MLNVFSAVLLSLLFLTGCRGCTQPANQGSTFQFPKGAEKAAALNWQPWSGSAAKEARATGKPILISVSDPLCYWCDVLDRTTLSNERVIELLQEKFILVRVETERQPHVAARLESGLPAIAALQPGGNQVWFANYLQPTPFNQGLYKVLRDEMLPIAGPGSQRYVPRKGLPADDAVTQMFYSLSSSFEYTEKTYPGPRNSLALSDLRLDVAVGPSASGPDARDRVRMHLDSVMKYLRDPAGGFATGTYSPGWQTIDPVKFAHEQAEMAAVISRVAQTPWAGAYRDFPAYTKAAEQAVAWLEANLWTQGSLLPGQLGTPAQFQAGEKPPKRSILPNPRTDAGGATAAALAQAGRFAGNRGWITLAEKVADAFLTQRTPRGLFWHTPALQAAPNELADGAAMLDAAVSLYEATGKKRWLDDAQEIALALELLSAPEGYFLDTTTGADAMFPPEPLPAPNLRAASALWRLGNILQAEPFRERARMVVMAFAGAPAMLERNTGDYGVLVFQMTGPTGRLELPMAWQTLPAAAPLVGHYSPRVYLTWTDGEAARICEAGQCSPGYADPARATAALASYLKTLELPKQ